MHPTKQLVRSAMFAPDYLSRLLRSVADPVIEGPRSMDIGDALRRSNARGTACVVQFTVNAGR